MFSPPYWSDHTDIAGALALEFLRRPERRTDWREFYDVARSVPPLPIGNGEWMVATWRDVRAAMACPAAELTPLYPSTSLPVLNELMLGMLPYKAGAEHRALRSLVQPLFTSAAVAPVEHLLYEAVDRMLDPAVFDPGGMDVESTIGTWLPSEISTLMLDIPPSDRGEVGEWARILYRQMGTYDQDENEVSAAIAALDALRSYVETMGNGPTIGPKYGGVGAALLRAHAAGALSGEELLSYVMLFLLTGLDTVTYALGNSICFLGSSPAVFARIRRCPEDVDRAFAEALRLWGPIRLCVRHLRQPLVLEAGTIPADALTFILIHAANRDPNHLAEPDSMRWDRLPGDSMAFGVGPHGCLGGTIGQMAGRVLFRWLATRCERIVVTPPLDEATFVESLPILGIRDVRLSAVRAAPA